MHQLRQQLFLQSSKDEMPVIETILRTERLKLRKLQPKDIDLFYQMMSNPNVMNPVPQGVFSRSKSDEHFNMHSYPAPDSTKKVWAVTEGSDNLFIGLAAFLKNEKGEDEIGYRLLEKHWGKGYGTELAKGLLDYGFGEMHMDTITADVYIENRRSIKILEKFFTAEYEFYNEYDKCTDRRYRLTKSDWLNR